MNQQNKRRYIATMKILKYLYSLYSNGEYNIFMSQYYRVRYAKRETRIMSNLLVGTNEIMEVLV